MNKQVKNLTLNNLCLHHNLPLTVLRHKYQQRHDSWHRHEDFFELVIVYNGSAKNDFFTGNKYIYSGNVFVMPPGSEHRYSAIHDFQHYNVLFSKKLLTLVEDDLQLIPGFEMLCNFPLFSNCSKIMYLNKEALTTAITLAENTQCELSSLQAGCKTIAKADFLKLIVFLSRNCTVVKQSLDHSAFKISQLLQYMEVDYDKQYSLNSMALQANMSASSFRHHFSTVTGLSPINYLIKLRLRKAMPLLLTPMAINAVANEVGFSDFNYFSRQFSKIIGFSPSKFREKLKNKQLTLAQVMELLE
jgi:AraC-like DNA-binding protein